MVDETLGVVIPAYKESENISRLILEIIQIQPKTEIIVVDDSPDLETMKAVESLNLPNAAVIHRSAKGGRGSAVLEGVRILLSQGCTPIIEMDADFSHPPSQIPQLISLAAQRNTDLLIASRYLPGSSIHNWPFSRRLFSRVSNKLARFVLNVPIVDYTNGYRLYSRRAAEVIVDKCGKMGKGFISLSEILVTLYYRGYSVGEIPTSFTNRLRGESSVNFSEVKNALTGLLKIFFLKRELLNEKKR